MSAHFLPVFFTLVALYMATVCIIGAVHYRRASNEAGFLVANRSLGPIIGGATLMANQVSAGATIGVVGFHYFSGFSFAWTWPLVWVGWLIAALFIAPKIRDLAGYTLPDYFEARFASKAARGIAAVMILVAYAIMMSAQYQAGGLLFTLVTGMPYVWAVALVATITTVYTVLGGMYSNAYVGLIKAVLLLAAYVTAVPFLLQSLGGVERIGVALEALDPRLLGSWFSWRELIAISLAVGLGVASAPYEISAIYAMQNRKTTRLAIGYSFIFQGAVAVGVLLFGLSMRVAVPKLPEPDLASPMLGMNVLPFWLGQLVLLAVVVTFTRTGGAILLTVASAVSHDLYGKLIRPDAPEKTKVLVSRLAVLSFSVIPVLIALRKLDLVNFVVIYAAKLMVSFVFIPVIVGLNWRRATRAGALASMIGGGVACLIWSVLGDPYFLGLDAAEAGILAGAILIVVVSLGTRPVAAEHLRVFFQDSTTSLPHSK